MLCPGARPRQCSSRAAVATAPPRDKKCTYGTSRVATYAPSARRRDCRIDICSASLSRSMAYARRASLRRRLRRRWAVRRLRPTWLSLGGAVGLVVMAVLKNAPSAASDSVWFKSWWAVVSVEGDGWVFVACGRRSGREASPLLDESTTRRRW